MLYELRTSILNEFAIVDLSSIKEKYYEKYYNYFIEGFNDRRFLEHKKLVFTAQQGYNSNNIVKIDYLKCSSPVPIFSQRFVKTLHNKLSQDIEFIPCKVICNNIIYDFYVGRILNFIQLIDKEKSEYYELSEGEKIIDIPVYSSSVNMDFYIARDSEEKNLYAITDKMKEMLTEYNFNIILKEV
ncbi:MULTISPECIES: hypothetical protein [unclassified Gilliamella]|uniref:hypothetical protein n=1 Tax=unclassified Gilliamella TaxID=2685620 RepID=UPI00130A60AB|nr:MULTISPECIES: hypothetical protein [unclassified Gilliamella]MWP50398.1 hypothetical protein [Gilliamella sp. Lep-s35]MWP70119.1 hypothetical protein [Gilliamella sp. Lep-s5]MWP78356.1 hypothetical protein [Gilliamella sp. Lep-s21]